MRALTVLAGTFAALAAFPVASSLARQSAVGDGCFVVRDGFGIVDIKGRGTVLGRFDEGQVTIDDPLPDDGTLKVYGAEQKVSL